MKQNELREPESVISPGAKTAFRPLSGSETISSMSRTVCRLDSCATATARLPTPNRRPATAQARAMHSSQEKAGYCQMGNSFLVRSLAARRCGGFRVLGCFALAERAR